MHFYELNQSVKVAINVATSTSAIIYHILVGYTERVTKRGVRKIGLSHYQTFTVLEGFLGLRKGRINN